MIDHEITMALAENVMGWSGEMMHDDAVTRWWHPLTNYDHTFEVLGKFKVWGIETTEDGRYFCELRTEPTQWFIQFADTIGMAVAMAALKSKGVKVE